MMPHKFSLKFEIIFALVIKFLLLFFIWKIFFSHPLDKNLTSHDVGNHIILSTQLKGSL